jgi:hypothetical protein
VSIRCRSALNTDHFFFNWLVQIFGKDNTDYVINYVAQKYFRGFLAGYYYKPRVDLVFALRDKRFYGG